MDLNCVFVRKGGRKVETMTAGWATEGKKEGRKERRKEGNNE
jgi:hypothetical protein